MKKQIIPFMFSLAICTTTEAFATEGDYFDNDNGLKRQTLEFIAATFEGTDFTNFTYGDAQSAFIDIGCNVKPVGLYHVSLSYTFANGEQEKCSYVLPREGQRSKLYPKDKHIFKNFLSSINAKSISPRVMD